jgi:hypothetical protein
MFFLKKNLKTSNLLLSKKVRNALFFSDKFIDNVLDNKVLNNKVSAYKMTDNQELENQGIKSFSKFKQNPKKISSFNTYRDGDQYLDTRYPIKDIDTIYPDPDEKKTSGIEKNFISPQNVFHNYFKELICQLKKHQCKFGRIKLFSTLVKTSRPFSLKFIRVSSQKTDNKIVLKRKKMRKIKRRVWIKPRYKDPDFTDSLINLLKIKTKFQYVSKAGLKYCKLFFKYTGSNFFGTITDTNGNVYFSYSSGIFSGLNTRKEKTTIFVVKQLGHLLSLRLYKSNVGEITFIPLINHRKIKTLLRFLVYGFREMKMMKFVQLIPKRKIMRNGVRLKKVARK